MPKISVIMPVHNCSKFLNDAVQSILCQTEKDFELLIYDDGSTDDTPDMLKSFEKADKRIRIFLNDKNKGIVTALNSLIDQSQGEYVARMDGDDIALPERLEKQLKAYPKDRANVLLSGGCQYISESGEVRGNYQPPSRYFDFYMQYRNPFVHPTLFTKTSLLKKFKYREGFRYAEDYDMYCRMFSDDIEFRVVEGPILKYRVYSGNLFNKEKAFLQNIANLWIQHNLRNGTAMSDLGELVAYRDNFNFEEFSEKWGIYANKLTLNQGRFRQILLFLSIIMSYPKYDSLTRAIVRTSLHYRGHKYVRFMLGKL